jgi:hypothetical protein
MRMLSLLLLVFLLLLEFRLQLLALEMLQSSCGRRLLLVQTA